MQSAGPEPRAGPSPRWAGGVRVVVYGEGGLGVYGPGLTQGHCVRGAFRTLSLSLRFDCGSKALP